LIEKYEDRLNWNLLSRNHSVPWTEKLIKKYKKKIAWKELSYNQSLDYTIILENPEWNWDIKGLSRRIYTPPPVSMNMKSARKV
jgi:hypothetical protein